MCILGWWPVVGAVIWHGGLPGLVVFGTSDLESVIKLVVEELALALACNSAGGSLRLVTA